MQAHETTLWLGPTGAKLVCPDNAFLPLAVGAGAVNCNPNRSCQQAQMRETIPNAVACMHDSRCTWCTRGSQHVGTVLPGASPFEGLPPPLQEIV